MKTSDIDILLVPGLGNSGPDHWQSRWEDKLSTARRIEQADWDRPSLDDWSRRVVAAARQASRPVVFIAHSLGTLAVAHAAAELRDANVAGAFLVAPPAARVLLTLEEVDRAFAQVPRAPLPFPTVVVASRNDDFAHFHETAELAQAWGAALADAGEAGHVNAASGHGPWPEGLMRFAGFLKGLRPIPA